MKLNDYFLGIPAIETLSVVITQLYDLIRSDTALVSILKDPYLTNMSQADKKSIYCSADMTSRSVQ